MSQTTSPILQSIIDSAKILKRNYGAELYAFNKDEWLTITPKEACLWRSDGQQQAVVDIEKEEVTLNSCDACDFCDILEALVTTRLEEDANG
ncbi:hypothetical protein D3C81_351850 [compost metagenome]